MRVVCPICRQATTWEENKHRPFCSERCRMVDLGTWAAEGYSIPGETAHDGSAGEAGVGGDWTAGEDGDGA